MPKEEKKKKKKKKKKQKKGKNSDGEPWEMPETYVCEFRGDGRTASSIAACMGKGREGNGQSAPQGGESRVAQFVVCVLGIFCRYIDRCVLGDALPAMDSRAGENNMRSFALF